ncbi:chemotaxis protein CheW [Amphritea sp. HPY]|uniref:chemotaxis protein CheA n=1 Tax=Amphritea sp. HPY TaxID=3421652 RepID=UPI003D7D6B86
MALDVDQEILADFLVEAGEILELLSEQLVDLEQHPSDRELLNAIFRGFHTVKGGAGFLQLEPMVDCCHSAENLFDRLRNEELQVSSQLMDLVLQALDAVNAMFESVHEGDFPEPAAPSLIADLNRMASGQAVAQAAVPPVNTPTNISAAEPRLAPVQSDIELSAVFDQLVADLGGESVVQVQPAAVAPVDSDLITETEFDALLDELHGDGAPGIPVKPATPVADPDLITEAEFDAMLDQLHGPAGTPGQVVSSAASNTEGAQADREFDQLLGQLTAQPETVPGAPASDMITEDEFESLLDDLQQKGEGAFAALAPRVVGATTATTATTSRTASKPHAPANKAPAKVDNKKTSADSNVRVDTRLLDQIMNMVGELVLVRNRLVRLGAESEGDELNKTLGSLDMVTADLQASVMKTRMQPVKKVFGRFPRLVRDLSRQLGKEVSLELKGEDTDLDKNLVEALADPLIHLVRNAIDHGIEAPATRQQQGKPREGHVLLSAEQEGDHILLVIEDDGAGMDAEKLRALAVERGMLEHEAAERLTEQDCYNLIFSAGFSTKKEISDVSGRGVGMDVVKTKISQLNGKLEIDSSLGEGSRIEIQVPLTLAIMPTLMILLEGQAFALPLVNVNEIFSLDLTQINRVDGQQVIIVRDKAMPVFHLKRWLIAGHSDDPLPQQGHVVIANVGAVQVAFVVDQLVGQEEVVIKPLGSVLLGTPGLSGATITGDGKIALILDVPNLLKHYTS